MFRQQLILKVCKKDVPHHRVDNIPLNLHPSLVMQRFKSLVIYSGEVQLPCMPASRGLYSLNFTTQSHLFKANY